MVFVMYGIYDKKKLGNTLHFFSFPFLKQFLSNTILYLYKTTWFYDSMNFHFFVFRSFCIHVLFIFHHRCDIRDPTGGSISDIAWNPDQGNNIIIVSSYYRIIGSHCTRNFNFLKFHLYLPFMHSFIHSFIHLFIY